MGKHQTASANGATQLDVKARPGAWSLVCVMGCLLALLIPFGSDAIRNWALIGGSVVGVAGSLYGILRHKPERLRPWIACAIGLFVFGVANSLRLSESDPQLLIGIGEASAYVCMLIAALDLAKYRNIDRDPTVSLDALIIASGVAAIVWIGFMLPYIQQDTVEFGLRAVDFAAGTLTVAIVFAIARYVMSAPGRSIPVMLLLIATVLAVLSELAEPQNVLHNIVLAHGSAILALTSVGAAIAHPQINDVVVPFRVGTTRLGKRRIASLSISIVASPAALVTLLVLDGGDLVSYVGLAVASLLVNVLVMLRVFGMMRTRENDARLDGILRESVKQLVASPDDVSIERAVIASLQNLLLHTPGGYELAIVEGEIPDEDMAAISTSDLDDGHEVRFPFDLGTESTRVVRITSTERIPVPLLEALEALVGDVSLATQRSQALSAKASMEERRRIERDLHDDVQQRLLGLRLRLSLLKQRVGSEAGDMVDVYGAELGSTVRAIRHIVHGETPNELAQYGLLEVVRKTTASLPGVEVVLNLPADEPTNIDFESAYYVFCEALANVLKHSEATNIAVSVVEDEQTVVLKIVDNGCGFDSERRGFGLRGMQTRLGRIGGSLSLESSADGTTLQAILPRSAHIESARP